MRVQDQLGLSVAAFLNRWMCFYLATAPWPVGNEFDWIHKSVISIICLYLYLARRDRKWTSFFGGGKFQCLNLCLLKEEEERSRILIYVFN